jgi:hypothetical protein
VSQRMEKKYCSDFPSIDLEFQTEVVETQLDSAASR